MNVTVYSKKRIAQLAIFAAMCGGVSVQAGAVGGPLVNYFERVEAHSTDAYYMTFSSGELGQIFLDGDGDTDLDLYVYDEYGNVVASDTDRTDTCLVQFYPRWTGTFHVKVVNLGGVYNEYSMVTN